MNRHKGLWWAKVQTRFSEDWGDGARNPNRFPPEVRLNQPELLDKWEKTPPEKRIFVIGSGEDFPKISEKAQSLGVGGLYFFLLQVLSSTVFIHSRWSNGWYVRPNHAISHSIRRAQQIRRG